MAGWLIDNYPEIADIPNANGDLAVHFAAAQGKTDQLLKCTCSFCSRFTAILRYQLITSMCCDHYKKMLLNCHTYHA